MQVQAINLATPKVLNNGVKFSHVSEQTILKNSKLDSFEKQSSQVSFTGIDDMNSKKPEKEKTLSDSMKNLAIKGKPFLLGLVATAAMVKMGDRAEELLFDNDGYSVSADGVQSNLVNIDSDEQIIEFKGTGIDINADDYDFVDWENGIFKNFDGSVDIDLGNNKFIDKINGIFVDPSERISAIMDGDYLQPMAVPNFKGYQTWPYPVNPSSPERYNRSMSDAFETLEKNRENEKNIIDKISDFLKGLFNKDSIAETEDVKDIFGNDIILAKDNNGDRYLAPYFKMYDDSPVFAEFRNMFGKENATEAVNNEHLRQYIEKNHPEFGMRIHPYMQDSNISIPDETQDTSSLLVNPLTADLDDNGVYDYLEKGLSEQEAMQDENINGIPDFLESDDNKNFIPDFLEVDANDNGIPDFLENLVKSLFGAK